jgi:hypothetical protein
MLFFKEGEVILLHVPYHAIEYISSEMWENISALLIRYNFPPVDGLKYNDLLEGYILVDRTDEYNLDDVEQNEDDHVESYLDILQRHPLSDELVKITGCEDIMLCKGQAGYCDLNDGE